MYSHQSRKLVSVLMPIRNEAAFIERSLGSVLEQNYPVERMEVLIVDGMSDDGTREVIQQMLRRRQQKGLLTPSVIILDNPQQIVPPAFNVGVENANGDVIIRVDGHCEVPPDYIQRCIETLGQTGADNVGGRQDAIGETLVAEAIAIATSTPFGIGNAQFRYSSEAGYVDTVYLGAFRREVFDKVGGFDERLVRHQDYEFNTRIRQAGGKIFYSPDLTVRYYVRGNLQRLAKQYFQYGFWKAQVSKENPAAFRPRHVAAPLFVGALLGGTVLSPFSRLVRCVTMLLMAAYLTASCIASVVAASRRGWRYLPLLPVVFATLHSSWGLGFWRGVVRPFPTSKETHH